MTKQQAADFKANIEQRGGVNTHNDTAPFTISPARYAKGKMIIQVRPSGTGYTLAEVVALFKQPKEK